MKDILVVGKLKEGAFEKFMGFMQSDEGMAERKKVADVTKTIASVSPIFASKLRSTFALIVPFFLPPKTTLAATS